MKAKLLTTIFLAVILLNSCVVEDIPLKGGSVAVVIENDQTKTSVTDKGHMTWSAGDQVWLQTTSGHIAGTLSDGAGTSDAIFSYGPYFGQMTGKGVYPYNSGHSISGDVLNIVLPSSYELGTNLTNTNAVMYGVNKDGYLFFSHLAGVMRFHFKNVPAGTDKFTITLDKKISGTFEVDLSEDCPIVETESSDMNSENTVSLNFEPVSSSSEIKLYVPLPVGTYESLEIALYVDGQLIWNYSNTISNTINRKTLKLMPAIDLLDEIVDLDVLFDLVDELQYKALRLRDYSSYLYDVLYQTRSEYESEAQLLSEKQESLSMMQEDLENLMRIVSSDIIHGQLSDCDAYASQCRSDLSEVEDRLENCQLVFFTLAEKLANYKNNSEGFEERISEMESKMEQIAREMEDIEDRLIPKAYDKLESLVARITLLFEELYAEFPNTKSANNACAYSAKPSSVQQDEVFEQLENDIYSLNNEINSLIEYYYTNIYRIEEIQNLLNNVENISQAYITRKKELQDQIKQAELEKQEIQHRIQNLEDQIPEIETNYEQYYMYYSELQDNIDVFREWIDRLYTNIHSAQTIEDWIMIQQRFDELQIEIEVKSDEVDDVLKNLKYY